MLRERLQEIPYQQPPWSTRYSQLLTVLDDQPMAPKGNVFRRNVSWGGRWDDIEGQARPFLRFEQNLIGEDPCLGEPQQLDLRLHPDSPAWKIGFKPIEWEKIGLYQDDTRASWPVAHPFAAAPADPAAPKRP